MKAIAQDTYGTTDVLEYKEIERPEAGDGEVLVRVRAAGLDAGVWHLMAGLPYVIRLAGYGVRVPKYPVRGMDVAGVVEAIGEGVTRFEIGDEVFGTCDGSFAEFVATDQDRLIHKPASLTFEQAAAVPISAFTALQGLRDHAKVQPGQKVLIVGAAGGVGSFAVQIAKAMGAEVTGVCSTGKIELVRSLGADHVIDYTETEIDEADERYDVILDIAGSRPLKVLRGALDPKGTLVIVGGEGGDRFIGGTDRQLRAMITSLFVGQKMGTFMSKENQEDLHALVELIEAGKVSPVIDRTYPLIEAADAIRYQQEGHVSGKVVITV